MSIASSPESVPPEPHSDGDCVFPHDSPPPNTDPQPQALFVLPDPYVSRTEYIIQVLFGTDDEEFSVIRIRPLDGDIEAEINRKLRALDEHAHAVATSTGEPFEEVRFRRRIMRRRIPEYVTLNIDPYIEHFALEQQDSATPGHPAFTEKTP